MIRRILIAIALLVLPSIASAREAFHGWCELGNQSVVTQGLSSTTKAQQSNPQCVVTVFVHGGGLATIYSDNNGTVLANPFQAALNGLVIFYANDGRYDIQFSPGTTYLDWLLCDPFTPGAVCSGASSGAHNLLSTTHLDTIPASPPVRGDIITAQNQTSPTGVNPSWARLPLGTNGQVLLSNGVDALWGNLTAGTGITITNNTGSLTISSSGGGGGCTLPGINNVVLEEHPIATCTGSLQYTWDAANTNLQIASAGSPNTVGTNNTFQIGPGNDATTNTFDFVLGDANFLESPQAQSHLYVLGSGNAVSSVCSSGAAGPCAAGQGANITTIAIGSTQIGDFAHAGTGGANDIVLGISNLVFNAFQVESIGANNFGRRTIAANVGSEQNGIALGGTFGANCINAATCASAGTGIVNGFGVFGDSNSLNKGAGSTGTITQAYIGGLNNRINTTLGNVSGGSTIWGFDNEIDSAVGNDVQIFGASNTSHTSGTATCLGASDAAIGGALNVVTGAGNFMVFGGGNVLTSLNCVAIFGDNITATAANTAYYGMSPNAGLRITASNGLGTGNDTVSLFPQIFSHYPTCTAGTEGSFIAVTDATLNTNGSVIAGSSTHHVLGYCDGTNWKIVVGT